MNAAEPHVGGGGVTRAVATNILIEAANHENVMNRILGLKDVHIPASDYEQGLLHDLFVSSRPPSPFPFPSFLNL